MKTERIAWKITAQRDAAAQAARELVAKSHSQWNQTQKIQALQHKEMPKNKWNPNLKTGMRVLYVGVYFI